MTVLTRRLPQFLRNSPRFVDPNGETLKRTPDSLLLFQFHLTWISNFNFQPTDDPDKVGE